MANDQTGNPWIIDTVGILWDGPIVIKQIILRPDAAADYATFYYWNPTSALASMDAKTTTTSSGVVTSTGNFESTEAAAYGVMAFGDWCKTSTGTASANVRVKRMIASRDSDNQITLTPTAGVTDETSGVYYWKTYSPVATVKLVSSGTEKCTETWTAPGDGLHLPNLILGVLSASAVLEIYV
jgi:hypothetical protein